MNFDRLKFYADIAKTYTGEKLSLDRLAWNCRESAPKKWMKISSNSRGIFAGEIKKEIINPITKRKELWMYRCSSRYDNVLYSMLYVSVAGFIINCYNKFASKLRDSDEYLDYAEAALNQTLIRFDIKKGHFSNLYSRMLNNYTLNLIQKLTHATIDATREIKGKRIYHYDTYDLNMDDFENDYTNDPLDSLLPPQELKDPYDITIKLKEKYKKSQALMSWLIVDWQQDVPEIINYIDMKHINLNSFGRNIIISTYKKLLKAKNFEQLGFKREKLSDTPVNTLFDNAINELKYDVCRYGQ